VKNFTNVTVKNSTNVTVLKGHGFIRANKPHKCEYRVLQLGEKVAGMGLCNKGTSLLVPQTQHNRALGFSPC
jgi:hypothetical protein